jgi:hypothetical protein
MGNATTNTCRLGDSKMKIKIIVEVVDEFLEKKTLTKEEIKSCLEFFDKLINKKLYINDPLYHHLIRHQRNALRMGYNDWFMHGRYDDSYRY